MTGLLSFNLVSFVEGGGFGDGFGGDGCGGCGSSVSGGEGCCRALAVVVRMLYFLFVWLVVLVYHLPVAGVGENGCAGGDNDGSGVAGCCIDSLFLQNCKNLDMS